MQDSRTNNTDSVIEFIRKKNYLNLGAIGQGGLGKTILIKDEIINEVFVCKKYSPIYEEIISQYFTYFLEEIKILHKLYHINIVRVFNYYLYPEKTTGYILMEYISGKLIDEYLFENPDRIEDVFIQTIEGFRYLEAKGILHRDIRPANILINDEGIVKIIDFGFGKFTSIELENKSISLNWRYSTPSEFENDIYDNKTEVYFIGKLFEEILNTIGNVQFKFSEILNQMIHYDVNERVDSFFEIYRLTISMDASGEDFDYFERNIYQDFANQLTAVISAVPDPPYLNSEISNIIKGMEDVYRNSMLEDSISNSNKLIRVFIKGNFRFFSSKGFSVSKLKAFLNFFRYAPENKQKIVLNNLWERFEKIDRIQIQDDDLPF